LRAPKGGCRVGVGAVALIDEKLVGCDSLS
jgi:hypothetical protein